MKKELRFYRTKDGKEPFTVWLKTLKDGIARSHITNRLNRVILGNFGDCEPVGDGVYELRIHYGPGYRVYFSDQKSFFVLLLLGGSKGSQDKDINNAKKYLIEFRKRFYD